jgi:hypothetical protein
VSSYVRACLLRVLLSRSHRSAAAVHVPCSALKLAGLSEPLAPATLEWRCATCTAAARKSPVLNIHVRDLIRSRFGA